MTLYYQTPTVPMELSIKNITLLKPQDGRWSKIVLLQKDLFFLDIGISKGKVHEQAFTAQLTLHFMEQLLPVSPVFQYTIS